MKKESFSPIFCVIFLIVFLSLGCLGAGYCAGDAKSKAKIAENDRVWEAKYETLRIEKESTKDALSADIDGLISMIQRLEEKSASYEGDNYENHSDWLDCHAALTYIDCHLGEIYEIDTHNPVPVIYMIDGRVMSTNDEHEVVQISMPPNAVLTPRSDIELSAEVKAKFFPTTIPE